MSFPGQTFRFGQVKLALLSEVALARQRSGVDDTEGTLRAEVFAGGCQKNVHLQFIAVQVRR